MITTLLFVVMGWVGIPFNLRVRNDYAITIALRLEISTDGISLKIHLCAGYIECVGRKGVIHATISTILEY